MSVQSLLERATTAGLVLRAEDGQLRCKGPADAVRNLTPELKAHKPELLALLDSRQREIKLRFESAESAGHWLILRPGAKPMELYFSPDVLRVELARWYPGTALIALPDTIAPPEAYDWETDPVTNQHQPIVIESTRIN